MKQTTNVVNFEVYNICLNFGQAASLYVYLCITNHSFNILNKVRPISWLQRPHKDPVITSPATTTTKNEVMLFAIYSFTSFSLNHFCLYHQYQMLVSETRHFSRFLGWSEIFDVIVFTVGQHKWCTVGWEEI